MSTPVIETVSDTARWVAAYRAMETDRPDALFHDHLARRLAGEQGDAIVKALLGGQWGAWSIIVRTAVFDEIILRAIAHDEVDLVLNLAAGLDTRPYRLPVPSSLRWVEVDFPGLIDHKERVLAAEKPHCTVERIGVDLSDVDARRAVLQRIGAEGKRVFVLTEGLVMYLKPGQIASLASDLADVPSIREWAMDLISAPVKRVLNLVWWRQLKAGNSMFQFAPKEGPEFFRPFGWQVRDYRGYEEEAVRFSRLPPLSQPWHYIRPFMPGFTMKLFEESAGMVVLERHPRR